jgi:hypothetical protein
LLNLFSAGLIDTNKNANTSKSTGDSKKISASPLDIDQQSVWLVRNLAKIGGLLILVDYTNLKVEDILKLQYSKQLSMDEFVATLAAL